MIGIKTRIAVFFAVILGITVLCNVVVSRKPSEEREERAKIKKNFDQTVAEGMRLWNPKVGVDSFRFDSCRVEKMRMGAFRLGGFNVLCIDGLVLNLPFPLEEDDLGVKSGGRGAVDAIAGLLPRSLLKKSGVAVKSFSGVRIKKLVVNRVENRSEVPVFAADEARNRGRTLELRNCRVYESGLTNNVGVARLVMQPGPALVWEGGELKLNDLLPNFNETKGEEK